MENGTDVIENCENYGEININAEDTGWIDVAGISRIRYGTISGCINKGNITILGSHSGGSGSHVVVAGVDTAENTYIDNCVNYGDINVNIKVKGNGNLKAINGISYEAYQINKCINYGNITSNYNDTEGYSNSDISGISKRTPKIVNCANYGDLTGGAVAGITGGYMSSNKKVYNCYNVGKLTGNGTIVGIGYQSDVENSYNSREAKWPIYASGNAKNCHALTGNETAEEKQALLEALNANREEDAETPWSEWKIDPNINNGYPIFEWEPVE